MKRTQKITRCALLAALALALSLLERLFPLPMLPGAKLGLANLVTLFALARLTPGDAAAILLTRCLLGALFAPSPVSLAYSLVGGAAALAVMIPLRRARRLSIYGVSVCGAAAHNVGQIVTAMLLLRTAAVLAYLPVLLLFSLLTGALNAFLAALLLRVLPRKFDDGGNHRG